jgi:SAM-dependent methyltransferase
MPDSEFSESASSYSEIFELRGQLYHQAMQRFPDARAQEFLHVLAEARIAPHMTVVDVPSGGAYISRYLSDAELIGLEPTKIFAELAVEWRQNVLLYENDEFPLKDASVDRVVSIAGLHHIENKVRLFTEMRRILKSDGLVLLADIAEGSFVQRFLDDFVGRYSATGHSGWYFSNITRSELKEAGLKIITDKPLNYFWCATDLYQLAEFCRILFGMVLTDTRTVAAGIQEYLGVVELENQVGLNWQLHCFACESEFTEGHIR